MGLRVKLALAVIAALLAARMAAAQDLPSNVQKIKEGIYVYVGKDLNSNAGIILTQEGTVLVDSGHNPTDSRAILATVRKLTQYRVRYLFNTEPHADHTTGHFLFSPPAMVVAHEGAGASMKAAYTANPQRNEKLMAESPQMRQAFEGYRLVIPQIEYRDKLTLNLSERSFELFYLKNVHSEADTAVWMPKERVLFSASAVVVNQFNIFRPNVTIPDILASIKMMKALNPEVVVPGHGAPGTVKIFEDSEKYYGLLLERVGKLVKAGKSLADIQKEVKMPEYDHWASKERFPSNVEAAFRAVGGK